MASSRVRFSERARADEPGGRSSAQDGTGDSLLSISGSPGGRGPRSSSPFAFISPQVYQPVAGSSEGGSWPSPPREMAASSAEARLDLPSAAGAGTGGDRGFRPGSTGHPALPTQPGAR